MVLPENRLSMYLYWILYLLDSTHLKNSLIPMRVLSSPSTLCVSQMMSLTFCGRLQYGSKPPPERASG